MVSFDNIQEKNLKKLKRHGYSEEKGKGQYEQLRYVGPATLILYNTNKLLVQGSKDDVYEATKLIKFLGITKNTRMLIGDAVGSDETLKGDTFGGIVVAAFKVTDKIRQEIIELGVKDSKELSKPEIVKLAQTLMGRYPKNYSIENIFPKEYNKLNINNNVTKILDILHKRCYNKLSRKVLHVVDQYPGCSVGNIIEKKADSKYPSVAAASIIARYAGLMQIKDLEQQAGFFIPLGSSNVGSALLELRKKSLNRQDYVKVKFKNVVKFFE
jgi:ribonuclease HIII